ncbi:MAG: hypothetical protein CMJ89_13255 [Planctomycetes bacterium]|jgi:uncharacterized protein YegL|nr:hypothetical protein [Planctomycetota bacterium]
MSTDYPTFDEEQVPFNDEDSPFENAEFVENPEPRCPCVLLLDTSSSMKGSPIKELNDGLEFFKNELLEDDLAAKRVEVSVVAFGPVRVESEFQTPEFFAVPQLEAHGDTPMGEAVEQAIELVRERKETFKANGVNYYRPWIFLITDGAPTDEWEHAAQLVHEAESDGSLAFFSVGVEGANMEVLGRMSAREPLQLDGLRFRDLFAWLSKSLQMVSHSQLGTEVDLPTPSGWATI